ncbi:MAG: protein kinase [Polyangiaceae bacterium]|nr:protein kinase [Polyangiaceae bacterium]MCB9605090.1 protein kinase [Polyangiaceae bacterium]
MNSATTQRLVSTCPECGAENSPASRFCNQCGSSLEHSGAPKREVVSPEKIADPLLGMVIAERYRIVAPIGRGGMGVVYRVEHVRIGKLMALKLLTGELTSDSELVGRFKREALMVSKLSHPNTVQVFDFGTSDGLTYLAMEFLDGRDLGRLIEDSGCLDPVRVARLTIQICSSLAEAHGQGMIHRDLKPENIIVLQTREGELVKVLDFGLAKLRESSEMLEVTSRGAIVGTPYYMSPEQVRGEEVDQRSDIYSLGALMYKALTGKPVFDAATPVGVLTKHLTDDAQAPSQRFPELSIPHGMNRIVMRLLAKDPAQRFQSVTDLQAALVGELENQGANSGVDYLLDSGHMRELERPDAAATRDEVERYERKLKRRDQAVWFGILIVLGVLSYGGFELYKKLTYVPAFTGVEIEPNDTPTQANPLPFGKEVRGHLGQRMEPDVADRDFFQVDTQGTEVSLRATALPNLASCLSIFRVGEEQALGRYCSGRPGFDLDIPRLKLEQGAYWVMLTQDRDRYGESAPPLIENVSDSYVLLVGASDAEYDEAEPNDTQQSAVDIPAGKRVQGRLAWMQDVDVFCHESTEPFSFEVAELSARQRGAVLEVTPLGGPSDRIPTRLYPESSEVKLGETDQRSPLRTPGASGKLCVKLRVIPDPGAPLPHPRIAPAGSERYAVSVVEAVSPAAPEPTTPHHGGKAAPRPPAKPATEPSAAAPPAPSAAPAPPTPAAPAPSAAQ